MAINNKINTALLFKRLAEAQPNQPGELVKIMTNFFRANGGKSDMPKTVADFVLYDQLAIVNKQNVNFFNGQWTADRSNFPAGNFQLPEGENAIILGFKVMTGANATVAATDWQPGVGDALAKQGTLLTQVNGTTVSTGLPLTAFDPSALSATQAGATDDNRGFFSFYEPIVLLGQTSINISAQWPVAAPTTANLNMRIELHGIRFIGS